MGYVANWPLVVATTNEGRQMYAYKNQPISVAVTAEEICRLLEEGAIVAAPKVEPAPVVEAPSPEGLDGLDLPGLRAHRSAMKLKAIKTTATSSPWFISSYHPRTDYRSYRCGVPSKWQSKYARAVRPKTIDRARRARFSHSTLSRRTR